MSQAGRDVVASFRSVRDFHASVAKLLLIATAKMNEHGWSVPLRWAACGSRGSKALYNSANWLPEDVFQFYRHESQPLVLAYIAAILDDAEKGSKLDVPILTAGLLRFLPNGRGANGDCHYPWCRTILALETSQFISGDCISVEPNKVAYGEYYGVEAFELFGRELLTIKDESTLCKATVDPLIERLNAYVSKENAE